MAKPDWGELQQRFLSEHATTGVSPKEWCEAQGLNYATARRYIKKPAAQKSAQERMHTAQKDKSTDELVDIKLSAKVKRFIAEYLKDNNATAAAARAGYSDPNYGRQLIANPNVAQAIAQQQKASIARTLGSADEVLAQMWQLATFDANQLSQYRRGACRYCWGFGHHYQWRDAVEFEEKRLEAVERDRREPEDSGGYGYDHNREPNPECPRCNGDGIGQPYFPDTRKLPQVSRLAYSGVKVGKNGVEITAISRERMFEAVMKRLGLADSEFAQRLQQIEIERRQAAAGAVDKADDLNSVFRAGAESAKQGSEGLKEQQNALKGLLENIDPVTKALNRLDEQQESLRKFQAKGFLDTDTFQAYNKILDDTRLKLTDTGEAAARAQAELAATQAAEKQSAALKNLLGSIDPTIRAFNSLDEQHAQLVAHFEAGRINGAQFEHFNTILNQTRERLSGVADVLPEALSRQEAAARRAGISVGQYSAAMRTLPAQFTDIATQLAGGQSPFLILLQQGGQIKDQFGSVQGALSGVGEYIRSMAGMINPTTIALGGLIGTIGLLAAAAYNSSEQFEQVARSVIMMGGAGFSSMQQLNQAAEEVAGKTNTSIKR